MQNQRTESYSDGTAGTCSRAQIVEAARKYLGCPWRHQGRARTGTDCAGLLVMVGWDLGVESWDPGKHHGYLRIPDGKTVNEIMGAIMDKLQPNEETLIPGHVVQIAYLSGQKEMVTHMGILTDLDGLGLIHAYFPMGRVVEHRLDEEWLQRVTGVFRIRGTVD